MVVAYKGEVVHVKEPVEWVEASSVCYWPQHYIEVSRQLFAQAWDIAVVPVE